MKNNIRYIVKPVNIGNLSVQNRVVIQPMEGCDCNLDGSPSDLTRKKYLSFAQSGAGIIWFEANAVCKEGRTNVRQMMLTDENADKFKALVSEVKKTSGELFGYEPICILQLTHSGRQSIIPICAYRNKLYEKTRSISDDNIAADEYLDTLPEKYVKSAILAEKVGFDGVDVKCCHGYLFQELLSAYNRTGKYGGNLQNRSRLYIGTYKAVKKAVGATMIVTSRFDPSDVIPQPFGFGTDKNGDIDLTEPKIIITELYQEGLRLMNITLGNPYYNPHVNRPFRKGGYIPPESPEIGLKRFRDIGAELKKSFPDIVFIGSGLSYYRDDLLLKAEEQVKDGIYDLVGFGRESIAYPKFFVDYMNGSFDVKKTCLACSKCTELMRAHQVSGCAVHNEFYRNLYREKVLCEK